MTHLELNDAVLAVESAPPITDLPIVLLIVLGIPSAAVFGWWFRRAVRREDDRWIKRIMVSGLLLKGVATVARFTVIYDLYEGVADAGRYQAAGATLADVIRGGSLPEQATQTGTPFVEFVTGLVFAVTGTNTTAGFVAFSMAAFIGTYLFYRAFVIAVPDGDHRRYAALVFLLPTLLFWPSSLGKDALMVFMLGVACYGAARAFRRYRFGFVLLGSGLLGAYMVRPHIAAVAAISFGAGLVLRPLARGVRWGAIGWVLSLVAVLFTISIALQGTESELPADEEAEGSRIEQIFAETDERTSKGGSQFANHPVRTPLDLPHAFLTVPFRPFPHETNNSQALLASLEGFFLLLLALASLPRLIRLPARAVRRPYLAMAGVYVVLFIIAFSHVGNFGILTRQRSQLLPLYVVLLAAPKRSDDGAERTEGDDEAGNDAFDTAKGSRSVRVEEPLELR